MIPLRDNVPTQTTPFVTYAILGINVLVFLAQWVGGQEPSGFVVEHEGQLVAMTGFEESIWRWGLRPLEITQGVSLAPMTPVSDWMTAFTSMFMHGGWLHLGGNMLYLWIFANNVEDRLGHARFILFYLLVGLAGAGAQAAVHPGSMLPMVGASGAIAGVMGAYALLHPRARVLTLIPLGFIMRVIEVPAVLFLGFWILLQLISAPAGGGTAWFAHIGGFVAGLALIKPLGIGRPPPIQRYVREG